MPNDASGVESNIAIVAAHWIRFGRALAGAISLEVDDRISAARTSDDIARDALRFRTITVLESVRALHDTGGVRLFRLLPEIPVEGPQDALSWRALIAMRNRMIHQWWTINDAIVLATVRDDFPILNRLAEDIQVLEIPRDDLAARAAVETARRSRLTSVIYQEHSAGLTRLDL